MMSLFNSFDLYFWGLSSILLLLLLSLLNIHIYMKSNIKSMLMMISHFLMHFFNTLKPSMMPKFTVFLVSFSVIFIALMNFTSIMPFNFSSTSQLSLVIGMSIYGWGSLMIFSVVNSTKNLLHHFIPEGAPVYLCWFLFIIELVSFLIRPITLTVRLTANILSGHLLMILLAGLIFIFPYSFPLLILLNTVELFVAIIQAYIFMVMFVLYLSEI